MKKQSAIIKLLALILLVTMALTSCNFAVVKDSDQNGDADTDGKADSAETKDPSDGSEVKDDDGGSDDKDYGCIVEGTPESYYTTFDGALIKCSVKELHTETYYLNRKEVDGVTKYETPAIMMDFVVSKDYFGAVEDGTEMTVMLVPPIDKDGNSVPIEDCIEYLLGYLNYALYIQSADDIGKKTVYTESGEEIEKIMTPSYYISIEYFWPIKDGKVDLESKINYFNSKGCNIYPEPETHDMINGADFETLAERLVEANAKALTNLDKNKYSSGSAIRIYYNDIFAKAKLISADIYYMGVNEKDGETVYGTPVVIMQLEVEEDFFGGASQGQRITVPLSIPQGVDAAELRDFLSEYEYFAYHGDNGTIAQTYYGKDGEILSEDIAQMEKFVNIEYENLIPIKDGRADFEAKYEFLEQRGIKTDISRKLRNEFLYCYDEIVVCLRDFKSERDKYFSK